MFGNGTRTYHNESAHDFESGRRVASTFTNAQAAHVWAQFRQSSGKSGNGNLYFEGRALFSYGRHYTAGFILPASVRDMGPGVFPSAELEGRGAFLVANDSASVSTRGHQADARGATHGIVGVPSYGVAESVVAAVRQLFDLHGFRPAELAARAESMLAGLAWDDFPRVEAAAAILKAAGHKSPDKAAERARAKSTRRAEEAAKASAKAKTLGQLSDARRAQAVKPDALRARIRAEAITKGRSRWGSGAWDAERWAAEGRTLFRAAKAAKTAGRVAQARHARALHGVIREELAAGVFELAARRSARRTSWGDVRKAVRLAVAQYKGESMPYGRGRVAPGRMESASYVLTQGADGLARMAEALTGERFTTPDWRESTLTPWAGVRARVAGLDPAELAGRFLTLAATLRGAAAKEDKAAAAQARKRKVQGLQEARDLLARTLTHQVAPAELVRALKAAESTLGSYAPTIIPATAYTEARTYSPAVPLPGAARVAGWTPERVGAELVRVRTARALAEVAEREARAQAARDKAQREAEARERAERERPAMEAEALGLWRKGEGLGELARFLPRADAQGGAYIRAEGVTRDGAGRVTGGTLRTSQGAEVPLTHALRVFAFLKARRDAGEGWQANGRALRVGPFSVDSVEPDGSFRAGCHRFAWAEVAQLANGLGVFDTAPADTTEPSGRH